MPPTWTFVLFLLILMAVVAIVAYRMGKNSNKPPTGPGRTTGGAAGGGGDPTLGRRE